MNAFRGCRRTGALLGAVLLAGAAAIVGGPGAQASSPAPIHGGVVPDTPRTGWPQITNGDLRGADRVAQFIVVGGTFTSMTLPDATVINQPYLAAFDIDTGAFNLGFRPVINGQVSSIETSTICRCM